MQGSGFPSQEHLRTDAVQRDPRLLYLVRLVIAALVLTLIPLFALPSVASHTTFVVNEPGDLPDAVPGDGICDADPGPNVDCTLRAAVMEANAHPGHDVITVPTGIWRLRIEPDGTINSAVGDLDVTDTAGTTINGAGATSTVIEAGTSTVEPDPVDRVFAIRNGTVTITSVTIRHGHPTDTVTPTLSGGGISVDAGSELRLGDSIVTANMADAYGGGIYSDGSLMISNSTITANSALGEGGGGGGGISSGGSLVLNQSRVTGNSATNTVGGGLNNHSENSTSNIMGSTIDGNSAGTAGGGIHNGSGMSSISNSTISSNNDTIGEASGGGISNVDGTVWLTSTVVEGNSSVSNGGGISNQDGFVSIFSSTITRNSAQLSGGGLWSGSLGAAQLHITSTTISFNTATTGGGGGIYSGADPLTIFDSMILGNTAGSDAGGIYVGVATQNLIIQNSAVSGNEAEEGDGGGMYLDSFNSEVRNVTMEGNQALNGDGGAIYGVGGLLITGSVLDGNVAGEDGGAISSLVAPDSSLDLLVFDSTITGNSATEGDGGGLSMYGGSTARIERVHMQDNSAALEGGGIYSGSIVDPGVVIDILNSVIDGNDAHHGGGIYASEDDTLRITGTAIVNNEVAPAEEVDEECAEEFPFFVCTFTAPGNGGGIWHSGVLEMTSSTVSGNDSSGGNGGGIYAGEGSSSIVSASVIDDNSVVQCACTGGPDTFARGAVVIPLVVPVFDEAISGSGGGIWNAGQFSVTNITVADNESQSRGGGIYHGDLTTAFFRMNNTTVAGNVTDGRGGGVYSTEGDLFVFLNSIIGDNISTVLEGDDCFGPLTSEGYNLVENPTDCTITGDETGNIYNQDPRLGPLANNGGPTRTKALLSGSPAIDAANPSPPESTPTSCASADQRGVVRPQDGDGDGVAICDMGAYEVRLRVTVTPTSATNTVGETHTVTATVTDPDSGEEMEGVTVTFAFSGTSGESPTMATDTTDSSGRATATFTSTAPGQSTITATVSGAEPATATKTWVVGEPDNIVLTPDNATNTAGDPHTVTATVTDELGNPVADGTDVTFTVTGVGATEGVRDTSGGVATFTFISTQAGTSTITARSGDATSNTVTKTWIAGAATNVDVEPPDDENVVGQTHTVTATVTDQNGNPVSGTVVTFTVTGTGAEQPKSATDTTDSNGEANFSFTSTKTGTSQITATAGSGTGNAQKRWIGGASQNIVLTPTSATNIVGAPHRVTATVTDQHGNPVPDGRNVTFTVTGRGATEGVRDTSGGVATFTFTSTQTGSSTITARSNGATSNTANKQDLGCKRSRLD